MICPRCGNVIDNDTTCKVCGYSIKSTKTSNIKMILIGLGAGFMILLLVFCGAILLRELKERYYFSDETTLDNSAVIKTPGGKNIEKSAFSTSIIYDNTYSKVRVKGINDAKKLIIEDSVSQKEYCPKEILEIEDDLINNYHIVAVNMCEMELNLAKEVGNVYKEIYNDYPNTRTYLTNLTIANTSISDNYIAAFMPVFTFATSNTTSTYPWIIKTQLILNSRYFLNSERLEATVVASRDTGHFPANATLSSPVAHELGHYLSFIALLRHYKLDSVLLINKDNVDTFYKVYEDFQNNDFSYKMLEKAYNRYLEDNNPSITFDEFRSGISEYAMAQDNSGNYIYDETIAEAFHDIYLNKEKANIASKYIIEILKQELES